MIRSALNHIVDFVTVILILMILGALFLLQLIFLGFAFLMALSSDTIDKAVARVEFVWKLSSESGDSLWFWFGPAYRYFQKIWLRVYGWFYPKS